jgi:glycosyltransferase involved in cell wall biosynthesis
MKVALISQNASPGLLIFRKDFIEYLVNQGCEVYAFAIDYKTESRSVVKAMGAIPVDYSLSKTGINPFVDLRDTWRLSRQLKCISPDVVFGFFVKPSIYGALAAWLAGVPRRIAMLEGLGYIHTPSKHGMSFKKRLLQRVHGLLCTIGYAFANKVLFLNQDDPKDLSKVAFLDQKKLQVLGPIGLNLQAYPYSEPDLTKPVRFIFIARLLAEKGIFEYLAAARLIKQRFPSAEFVVLGWLDPDNPSALTKKQLDEVIKEDLIIYPGHVSNVNEWIANSHVFVLPSFYREGIPRSTQEAMAIGRAVITTDVPGCRETVVDGVNGFLVPPWNAEVLADKMLYFIENAEAIKRMGDESYRMAVEQYDVQKINPILVRIITGENK